MCYQAMQMFRCGHHSRSEDVSCRNPSQSCGGVFLRQEIEDSEDLCEVRVTRCQEAMESKRTMAEPETETEKDEKSFVWIE
ncbi:hypothetical protein CJF32_00002008 [Rutstroemia sp. NJR-2017a WRK4]|nr:hypothetical protein CJF32_00002008 [Rutstroemia sp. NJR-2017a WRK4]